MQTSNSHHGTFWALQVMSPQNGMKTRTVQRLVATETMGTKLDQTRTNPIMVPTQWWNQPKTNTLKPAVYFQADIDPLQFLKFQWAQLS